MQALATTPATELVSVADDLQPPHSLFFFFFPPSTYTQNVDEIQNIYEHHFPNLTERFFKDKATYQPWPTAETIADLVDDDPLFITLYRELYYRHLYSKMSQTHLTLDHRFASYDNYCDLFNYILGLRQTEKASRPDNALLHSFS